MFIPWSCGAYSSKGNDVTTSYRLLWTHTHTHRMNVCNMYLCMYIVETNLVHWNSICSSPVPHLLLHLLYRYYKVVHMCGVCSTWIYLYLYIYLYIHMLSFNKAIAHTAHTQTHRREAEVCSHGHDGSLVKGLTTINQFKMNARWKL